LRSGREQERCNGRQQGFEDQRPTAEQIRSIGGRIAPNWVASIGRYVSSGPQWLDRPELDGVYKFQCLQIDGYQGDHLEAAASLSLAIAAG